jgi:hypothetical protein
MKSQMNEPLEFKWGLWLGCCGLSLVFFSTFLWDRPLACLLVSVIVGSLLYPSMRRREAEREYEIRANRAGPELYPPSRDR